MAAYVYLGQPYTHTSYEMRCNRYYKAMHFVAEMSRKGITIYSPILHFHPMALQHSLPTDADFWQHHNYNMLALSSALWVLKLPGWQESKGLQWEITCAREISLEIEYYDPIRQ